MKYNGEREWCLAYLLFSVFVFFFITNFRVRRNGVIQLSRFVMVWPQFIIINPSSTWSCFTGLYEPSYLMNLLQQCPPPSEHVILGRQFLYLHCTIVGNIWICSTKV